MAVEQENPAGVRLRGANLLLERSAGKLADHFLPERQAGPISFGHSDHPSPGESAPKRERRISPDTGAAMPAEDEKLRDVEVRRIGRGWGTARGQHEPDYSAAGRDEKRKPGLRLGPVSGQVLVAEASVRIRLERIHHAEVMDVELEQVREYGRPILRHRLEIDDWLLRAN